jgi:cell division initiation protein
MSYTPVELRHVRVGRRPLGYHRGAVEQILSDVADSFETVWRDRGELADRVEELEEEIEQLKHREQALTNTLVAAEHAAGELKERAKQEAELIVAEAHGEARSLKREALAERERLLAEVRRIQGLLSAALGLVVEAGSAGAVPDEPPAQPEPERADTGDARPLAAAAPSEPGDSSAAPAPEAPADSSPVPEADEPPGWPRLRRVAQGGASFDWGD